MMLEKIKPQVFLACGGLIGMGIYTAAVGLTEIAAAAVAGLVAIATRILEKDE